MPNTQVSQVSSTTGAQNADALKNIANLEANAAKVGTPVSPRVAHALLVNGIIQAAGSFKSAINMEVAVCLTVYAEFRNTGVTAKKELYAVYKEAGYDCEVGGTGKDYKTVNRRMGYAAQFYDSLPRGKVEEFMGDETKDLAALMSIVNHLTQEYNFRSMNDVLTAAGVTPPQGRGKAKPKEEGEGGNGPKASPAPTQPPSGGTPAPAPVVQPTATDQKTIDAAVKRVMAGEEPTPRQATVLAKYGMDEKTAAPAQPDAGDQAVAAAIAAAGGRRETDSAKWVKITYDGATMLLPSDMKPEALLDLGIKLTQVAGHMSGKATIDAKALTEAFSAVAAAH